MYFYYYYSIRPTQRLTRASELCAKNGRLADAVRFFEEMQRLNELPDQYTFTTLIEGFGRSGDIAGVMKYYYLMIAMKVRKQTKKPRNKLQKQGKQTIANTCAQTFPTEPTYILLLRLLRTENIALAQSVVKDITARTIVPTTRLYNAMLHVLSVNGRYDAAKQLWSKMRAHEQPDSVDTYRFLMHAAVRDSRPQEAKQMFRSMQAKGIKPTRRIYLMLLQSVCSAAEAADVFALMRSNQVRIEPWWYLSAFLGLRKSRTFTREAEQLYKLMLAAGIVPDAMILVQNARFAITADAPQLADFFIAEAVRMNVAQSLLFELLLNASVPSAYRAKVVDFCMRHITLLRVAPTEKLGRLLLTAAARCRDTDARDLMLRELQALGMQVTDSHRTLVSKDNLARV